MIIVDPGNQLCIRFRVEQIGLCILIILQGNQIPNARHGHKSILEHLIINAILQIDHQFIEHRK